MDKYNEIQRELVKTSEAAHYNGLRHKGLSGTICEDALIKKLRIVLPEIKFDRGVIKFGGDVGEDLNSHDLTTQIDIIIYKGEPVYESQEHVVVDASNVLGVIEVKKWSYPKKLLPDEKLTLNLVEIQAQFDTRVEIKLPVYFVSFRFKDRKTKDVSWFTECKKLPFNSYCFFGGYSSGNGRNSYPWEEGERWCDFDDKRMNPYADQFEMLINDIKSNA